MVYTLSKKIHEYLHVFSVFFKRNEREDSVPFDKPKLILPNLYSHLPDDTVHTWPNDTFKVFLSHLARDKDKATELKKKLEVFGVSCFVAHLSIRPTREWQDEIERALFSMDALIALLTKDFQKSSWTDQEIGIALGREVPVIPLKIEKNPYGFIGKIQAIHYSWEDSATKIVKHLMKYDKMVDAYIHAVYHCPSFEHGLKLAGALPFIERLSDSQVDLLIAAYNQNSQVRGCWGFSGSSKYGKGLLYHLNRVTGKIYDLSHEQIMLSHS